MDILLNLDAVTSLYNPKGLRYLFHLVESNLRRLRSLGVPPELYGSLLDPTAVGTSLGWVLSGPIDSMLPDDSFINLLSVHILRTDVQPVT